MRIRKSVFGNKSTALHVSTCPFYLGNSHFRSVSPMLPGKYKISCWYQIITFILQQWHCYNIYIITIITLIVMRAVVCVIGLITLLSFSGWISFSRESYNQYDTQLTCLYFFPLLELNYKQIQCVGYLAFLVFFRFFLFSANL